MRFRSALVYTQEPASKSPPTRCARAAKALILTAFLLVPAASVAQTKSGPAPAGTTKASAQPTASAAPTSTTNAHEIATDVDAAMSEKATAQFKEGNALFREGKFAQALASYKSAWALDLKNQRIVRNLGVTELELKMYRDAAEHLTIALRLADPKDPKRPSIERDIAEARAKVGTVNFTVKSGNDPVDGVELVDTADGKKYQTPLLDPVFVAPGKSTFRIWREGYESQEKVLELKEGETLDVPIALERAAGFGGKGTPTATPTTTAPVVESRSKMPGYVLLGGGGVVAIVGGVLLGLSASTEGEIASSPLVKPAQCGRTARSGEDPGCEELRSKAGFVSTAGGAGLGMLIGGAAIAAAGGIWLLLPSSSPKSGQVRVTPVASHQGGGLVMSGSF
ncbi:MAG: hypothetical protein IPK82_36395 [Polyangiaceae bacterium]|nr:hypothetical protein [Polyangiaceae bacterium]